jgi:hypothetical protein
VTLFPEVLFFANPKKFFTEDHKDHEDFLKQKLIAQRSRNQKGPPYRRIGEKTSSQKKQDSLWQLAKEAKF